MLHPRDPVYRQQRSLDLWRLQTATNWTFPNGSSIPLYCIDLTHENAVGDSYALNPWSSPRLLDIQLFRRRQSNRLDHREFAVSPASAPLPLNCSSGGSRQRLQRVQLEWQASPHIALRVPPGLSGLAQILQGPDTSLHGVQTKLRYDIHYLDNHGFWLDLRIALATPLYMVRVPGPIIARVFRFPILRSSPR